MSLDYDLTKCGNKELLNTPVESGISSTLIWGTMAVCLPEITKDNIKEWLWRLQFLARVNKCIGTRDGNDWNPTKQDLVNRIGLNTNAERKTRKQWLKRIMDCFERETNAYFRYGEGKGLLD